jgi:hypothetical protein
MLIGNNNINLERYSYSSFNWEDKQCVIDRSIDAHTCRQ